MQNHEKHISNNIIRQLFLILVIVLMIWLIYSNLSAFLPSLLGALTLYVVTRNLNFILQEKKKWKPAWASLFIILLCVVVLVIPIYFLGEMIFNKIGNTQDYLPQLTEFLKKIQSFILEKTDVDLLSQANITKIRDFAAKFSASAVSGTVNTFTVIGAMFFILYFLLLKPRVLERAVTSALPLKKSNRELIGKKFRSMVMANAVGIPVVALGQGLVSLVGYLIFGAPNPILLFALTTFASMLPVVGAAIIYVPVGIYMLATGNTVGGVGIILFGLIVVGLTDNVLRFTLLKKLDNIHPLNTVFGIILGVKLFGFMGLVFGPIMVSMTVLLVQIYRDEFSDKEDMEKPVEKT